MTKEDILFATNFINASLKIDPIYYNKDNLIVYSVPNELLLPFNELGNGWSHPEKSFTWTDGYKSVLIIQTANTDSDLYLM